VSSITLPLPGGHVILDYDDAVHFSAVEFADLYLTAVPDADENDAHAWAEHQVAVRDMHLHATPTPATAEPERVWTGGWPFQQPLVRHEAEAEADDRSLVMQALCVWPHDKQAELCTFPDCTCGVSGGVDARYADGWVLAERLWPNTLLFRCGRVLLEVAVPEDVWNAFER
jgi:hypothetical protein